MKILWVENHATFVAIAGQQFLSAYELTVVPSVAAALSALAQQTFDAVLVDYDLDDGKGSEVVEYLQNLPVRPLIVAASSHNEGNTTLLASGADCICSKMEFANIESILQRDK